MSAVITTVADLAGRALSTITGGLAALRSADKPLHPEGTMYAARLVRPGAAEPSGVPWFDLPGEDDVLLRLSRAIGLPGPIPDIRGMALRLHPHQSEHADLLLASTGWHPLTRHLLTPAWRADQPLTCLLPYRSPIGPVVIGARGIDDDRYELSWARIGQGWQPFGELRVQALLPEQAETSFDPVLNQLPGLSQYAWVEHLRERSYATARRSRGE